MAAQGAFGTDFFFREEYTIYNTIIIYAATWDILYNVQYNKKTIRVSFFVVSH